ncbi:hypothetical protein Csa_014011 [Cucumis sativus]|uniref:Uncharacterized protein n=1 Tax=Cucumis sativus TaxID=3659 RepID=A0A0A0LRM1_CUCSA|nr:hypothetical protein Csa_014011 [Cucumis sativus]
MLRGTPLIEYTFEFIDITSNLITFTEAQKKEHTWEGTFPKSLLDKFEWANGYTNRKVWALPEDYHRTLKRTPKLSFPNFDGSQCHRSCVKESDLTKQHPSVI